MHTPYIIKQIVCFRNIQSNLSYNQEALSNNPYNQQYHQNNTFGNTQNNVIQQNDGDAWNQAWGDEDNFNVNTQSQQRDTSQITHTAHTQNAGEHF